MVQKIKKLLAGTGRHGALIFDLWTDSYRRRAYITFTYHYISGKAPLIDARFTFIFH